MEQRVVPTALSIPTDLTAARGAVITVPINVDSLAPDAPNGNPNGGLSAGDFVLFYNATVFSVSPADVKVGPLPSAFPGWGVFANTLNPGAIYVGLSNSGSGIINGQTNPAGGTLVTVDLHVKNTAPFGSTPLDLAISNFGGPPFTHVSDFDLTDYVLNPPPVDNVVSLAPFIYAGSDPQDGLINITGFNNPPVANNDAFTITTRALAGDPALSVAAPGVLANDSDQDTDPITGILVSNPSHGTVAFNTNGSFIYTPAIGYVGPDSFTYKANDGTEDGNLATVYISVTPRLSIPSTLAGVPGGTVVVPVNLDNPNPIGSGGLVAGILAVNYDTNVFTVVNANIGRGTATGIGGVQTIDFGGNPTGGTFTLTFSDPANISIPTATTAPIPFSTVGATLASNIQSALAALPNIISAANVSVAGTGPFTVNFIGSFISPTPKSLPQMTANSSGLTGTSPSVQLAMITNGGWAFTPNVPVVENGQLGISFTSVGANTGNIAGSVALITFTIKPGAPAGPSAINLMASNNPSGVPVTTRVDGLLSGLIPLRPAATNASNDAYVDGLVYVGDHFAVTAPANASQGGVFSFTVTALDGANTTLTGYTGTVHFTSSDGAANLPVDVTLTNGVGTFSATLNTAGIQTITATDTGTAALTGFSNPINVSGVAAAATHFDVSAPTAATAGGAFSFTVTALDASNNTDTGYTGTVHFTGTDPQADYPPDATLINGVGTFLATLKTAGDQTITATDTVDGSINGTSNTIAVSPGAVDHFNVSAPANATAGVQFSFTVTARDNFGNTATGYAGTLAFTSSDSAATVPSAATLTSGSGSFNATLKIAGNQTLTVTDTLTASINGTTDEINVVSGPAANFSIGAPGAATAGVAFAFTVTAFDAFNNTATGYGGTVQFTSSDLGAGVVLPGNSTLTSGVGTFSATLVTAGNQTVTATDTVTTSIAGTSNAISVAPLAATHLAISVPGSVGVNTPFNFTVNALDPFNNLATSFNGTVFLTTTDSLAALPPSATLVNGTITLTATLKTVGQQKINGTFATSFLNGGNFEAPVLPPNTFQYTPTGFPWQFAGLSAVSTNGSLFTFENPNTPDGNQVAVLQQFGSMTQQVTLPPGTYSFSLLAAQRGGSNQQSFQEVQILIDTIELERFIPPSGGYTAHVSPVFTITTGGTHIFEFKGLNPNGGDNTAFIDKVIIESWNSSSPIAVGVSTIGFGVAVPANTTAGNSFNFTVTALDSSNNTDTGYSGTVHFTSSDGQAVLPAGATLTNGVGTFSLTLTTAGNQTITATDTLTASITGTNSITVAPAATTHFAVVAPPSATSGIAFNFSVTALDQFDNTATGYSGAVHFTSSSAGTLPGDSTLTNGVGTFSATLTELGSQSITATDTVTASITGTDSVNVTESVATGAVTHYAVSAPSSITAGNAFVFTVTALDDLDNTVVGTFGVNFTSTDSLAFLQSTGVLNNGVGSFVAIMKSAGPQTITATDTITPSITGTSNTIMVDAAAALYFVVSAPSPATAGVAFNFTVTAYDVFNNTATGYGGTLQFTATGAGTLPPNSTLTNGTGTFSATLNSIGVNTIGATDTATPSITWSSNAISVVTGPLAQFAISAPASTTAGNAFSFTVTALDAFNNTVAGYGGSVHFASSSAGSVPPDSTLTNGVGTFSATLTTAGSQTLTANDTLTPSIVGATSINVIPAEAVTITVSGTPTSITAGDSVDFTVTALDQFSNTATNYAGIVQLTSTDGAATMPADTTLTNGTGLFTIQLKTAGDQTVTATDTLISSLTGTSNTIAVAAGQATHFAVAAPSSATAGVAFSFTVTALDAFDNTASGYSGTVHFTSTSVGSLPGDSTLTGGLGSFSATLTQAGSQTITATDTLTGTVSGTSDAISVNAGEAALFAMSAPAAVTAGAAFAFSVLALDEFNNTATSYGGIVHFTTDDLQATVPLDATLTGGFGTFSATLRTAGNQTLTATDTVTGSLSVTAPITVTPGATHHFAFSGVPSSVIPGTSIPFTLTALDAFNNLTPGYAGIVHFSSTDSAATLPPNTFLSSGTGLFLAVLKTSGFRTLVATDMTTSSITGSSLVNVTTGTLHHFAVNAPASTTAGNVMAFTVTAQDEFNNTIPNGFTVGFTSNDPSADLPPSGNLTNGFGSFGAILKTAGMRTITAVDALTASITGTSNSITVGASAVHHFAVVAPASAVTGSPFNFNVQAQDAFNNSVTVYGGTVLFSSSDPSAVLPGNSTLTSGAGTFSATLNDSGNHTLTATDVATASITGTSVVIASRGLVVTNITPTHTGFTATFNKAFDPAVINLYKGFDGSAFKDVMLAGPAPSTFLIRGSLVLNSSSTGFTFIRSGTGLSGVLAAGQYTVTVRSASDGFLDSLGEMLDGNNDGTPGDDYTTTFDVLSTPTTILSLPDFGRGPDESSPIKVPNNSPAGSFIPITVVGASAVTDVAFTLSYDPALLTITGASSGPSGTFTLISNSGGVASFSFNHTAGLSGTVTLGHVLAHVPNSASANYKAMELLSLGSISSVGASGTPVANDAVHVVAYFGDVSGDGEHSPVDAALISRVAINTDTGFAAYDNADPAIVGDLNSNASVDSSDVTIMNRYLAGFPSAQIPLIPFGPVESAAAAGAMESIQPSGNVVTANSAGTGSSASLIPVASSESSGLPSSPIREVIVEMAGAGLELNAATSNFLSQSGVGGLLPTLQYSQAPSVAPDTGTAASLWDDLASSIVKTAPREGTLELGEMLEESIEWEAIDQIFAGEWREA